MYVNGAVTLAGSGSLFTVKEIESVHVTIISDRKNSILHSFITPSWCILDYELKDGFLETLAAVFLIVARNRLIAEATSARCKREDASPVRFPCV